MENKDYFVHESSYVDEGCKIGKGTKIWHFSHIMSGCVIGENCNIGQNVVISPDVVLGRNCMPTDLAFRLAARHVIFDWVEKESGEGWWGTEKFSDYYSNANNPFNWIRIHSSHEHSNPVRAKKFPGDHAGKLETSEAMYICPGEVELDRIDGSLWYARAGKDASAEHGDEALELASLDVEETLFGK